MAEWFWREEIEDVSDDPKATIERARATWNADREMMKHEHPEWSMPAWSRAPAWRKRPYLLAAKNEGLK